MFDDDFFEITINSILNCDLLKHNTLNYDYCFYNDVLKCNNFERSYYIYDETDDLKKKELYKFSNGKYHKTYFCNEKWEQKFRETVTYSNYQKYSLIKNSIFNIKILTIKDNLYKNIKGKKYCLDFVVFDIKNNYIDELNKNIKLNNELWFLKKSADTTLGGYDIFPIYSDLNFIDNLNRKINESNKEKKYESSIFILQKGVDNPILINDKKFDFRMYGLIVYTKNEIGFYFYKTGIIRKSMQKYDKNSTEKNVQLTNTTFNKKELNEISDYEVLTEMYDENHNLYNYYDEMKNIYIDVMDTYKNKFDVTTYKYGYHLIGLDFIIDNNGVYLLEINRSPAIYYDEDRVKYLHKNMEYEMFDKRFYKITIESIIKCNIFKGNVGKFIYCFSNK